MNALKSLLVVYEGWIHWGLPFSTLLNDISQVKDLVARPLTPCQWTPVFFPRRVNIFETVESKVIPRQLV